MKENRRMDKFQRIALGLLVLILAMPSVLLAGNYEVRPGIQISFNDPPSQWQVSTEPPTFLVAERAAHLHPPQLEAARKAGLKTPEAAARKMLMENELFLFNPLTKSHIEIDFSPLRKGDKPASSRSVRSSARYAADELKNEEGLKETKVDVKKTSIDGAVTAYRVDATFVKHGNPTRFIGLISFANNNWIYLYYTGPQNGMADHSFVNQWLDDLKISNMKK